MKLSLALPLIAPPNPHPHPSLAIVASCDRAINTHYTSSSAQRKKINLSLSLFTLCCCLPYLPSSHIHTMSLSLGVCFELMG